MRTIQYAVHLDEGTVISRVGDELAWPVLDFKAIGMGGVDKHPLTGELGSKMYGKGNFNGPTRYDLEKVKAYQVGREWSRLKWTRKLPVEIKNYHRRFWGFPPLKEPNKQQLELPR